MEAKDLWALRFDGIAQYRWLVQGRVSARGSGVRVGVGREGRTVEHLWVPRSQNPPKARLLRLLLLSFLTKRLLPSLETYRPVFRPYLWVLLTKKNVARFQGSWEPWLERSSGRVRGLVGRELGEQLAWRASIIRTRFEHSRETTEVFSTRPFRGERPLEASASMRSGFNIPFASPASGQSPTRPVMEGRSSISLERCLQQFTSYLDMSAPLRPPTTEQWEVMSRFVYEGCTQKPPENHSDSMYNGVVESLRTAAKTLAFGVAHDMVALWPSWLRRVQLVEHICRYLERFYVPRRAVRNILAVGRDAFASAAVAKIQPTRMAEALDVGLPTELMQSVRTEISQQRARLQELTGRWRRAAFAVGRFARPVRQLYEEVTYRPGNVGAKRARDEFEDMAKRQRTV